MATLTPADIQDFVNTTIKSYGKLKMSDISHDYQRTVAFKRIMKKGKMKSQDGGDKMQFTLLTDHNNSFRHVGIGETDVVNIPNVTTTGEVDWANATWNWSMDARLISMNSGSANKIFDIIQTQRIAAASSAVIGVEKRFWRTPGSTDTIYPKGVPYWIVKNNTEGFNGSVPSGFTVVGNINPTTYTRWKNYTAQYTAVTKADLVRKLRKAMYKTDFEKLVDELPTYDTGEDLVLYTNYATLAPLEELSEAQNDNLGPDVASMDGKMLFRKMPMAAITELDDDTTNPIYGVNWSYFHGKYLKGWLFRETPIPIVANQHTLQATHTDLTYQWCCYDRRRNFVIATDTTMPT